MKKWIPFIVGALILIYLFKDRIFETGEWIVEKIESTLNDLYKKWGELRGIDWKLLKAIAQTESSENPNVTGDDGRSIGLMQVQFLIGEAYAGVTCLDELFDVDKNIEAGSGYLQHLLSKYSLEGAIQAYNLGETKFNKGSTSPAYLAKVLKGYETLKGIEI